MTHPTPNWLSDALAHRERQGLLRGLWALGPGDIDFVSNDYLGLARHPGLAARAAEILAGWPVPHIGSTGSRLLAGNTTTTESLENQLAEFFFQPAALLFNSGYDANLALFSALPTRHCVVLYDALIHASVRDGLRLGLGRAIGFRHNDIEDLRTKGRTAARTATGRIFVAVEGVYSMDGDTAPLPALAALCAEEGWHLIVDEAHSVGLHGPGGRGLVAEYSLQNQVFATLATFGKAFGAHGAAVLGAGALRQFLINFARPFIYSTALPPHSLAVIQAALEIIPFSDDARQLLAQRVAQFRAGLPPHLRTETATGAIQPVPLPTPQAAREVAERLRGQGIGIRAVLPPTVPPGGQRLRVVLHSYNTEADVARLLAGLG